MYLLCYTFKRHFRVHSFPCRNKWALRQYPVVHWPPGPQMFPVPLDDIIFSHILFIMIKGTKNYSLYPPSSLGVWYAIPSRLALGHSMMFNDTVQWVMSTCYEIIRDLAAVTARAWHSKLLYLTLVPSSQRSSPDSSARSSILPQGSHSNLCIFFCGH